MLEGLSPLHLILILGIVLLVVGPRRLPELGSALGKTLREFRDATTGLTDTVTQATTSQPQAPQAVTPTAGTPSTPPAPAIAPLPGEAAVPGGAPVEVGPSPPTEPA